MGRLLSNLLQVFADVRQGRESISCLWHFQVLGWWVGMVFCVVKIGFSGWYCTIQVRDSAVLDANSGIFVPDIY